MRLGDLIAPAKVERCGDREFPVLSMTMHDGIVLQADRFKKAIASKDQSTYKVVKPGQLVVGFPIDEGVLYIQGYDHEGIMSPAYNVWNVDTDQVDTRYLELALHSPQSMSFYKEKMRGTTARRRSLPEATLVELDIPVPERCEQVKVVNTLLGIRAGITNLKSLEKRLNELVKSRFVEMFGDPTEQHGDWSFNRIDAFCDVITGNTPSRKKPEYYGDGIEWIKTDNITEAAYLTEASERLSMEGEKVGRVAPAGSVLMACIAGSVKSIGKVAIADRPVAFNQQINALVPHEGAIETEYLLWMLRLSKDYLCSDINMQLKGILNKTSLSKKAFSVPPLALQQEFAVFVQQVDKLKFETQQAIDKLQILYDSLAQEYFGSNA
ncbi:MAG: restriction endonuclease subunit S [Eggerthellaceae bacterium]|nr:restriction endonuclease subunit S [Eggerthellaceae bacterium]